MASPTIADFKSIAWCAEILNQPDLLTSKRDFPNPFFKTTLRLNDGIKNSIFRYRMPLNEPGTPFESYLILQLGSGIAGQLDIAHGGFLATVMDEVTGGLIGETGLDNGHGMFTVSLKTEYQKPVIVPGIILAVAKVVKTEGRKLFLEAVIKDEVGNICTKSEAIFVSKRPQKC